MLRRYSVLFGVLLVISTKAATVAESGAIQEIGTDWAQDLDLVTTGEGDEDRDQFGDICDNGAIINSTLAPSALGGIATVIGTDDHDEKDASSCSTSSKPQNSWLFLLALMALWQRMRLGAWLAR